jgi:hypothetical protein
MLAAMTVWAACADDGPATALRIEMVPNAALNSRQEVRDALDALEVVVDGTVRPLRGLPGQPGPVGDRVNAENRDRDDDLELVFTVDLARYADLPLVQIEPGHNGDQALLFRMCGLDGGGKTAATGQVVVAFQPGEVVRAQTPFNLRAEYRVPRVIAVQPDPDLTDVACDGSFAVIFSEAMDPISASAGFALRTPAAIVDGVIAMEDGSTRLEFDPAQPLAPGAYSLEVGTGALDEHGESLDQDPYTAGAQPFVLRFTVTCR